jgi:DNA-directed RNA polymerase subunit H
MPEERIKQLCREYSIERTDLPLIKESDPAIKHLACGPGDVIEIIRDSRTTDTARNYRLVVTNDGLLRESTDKPEWRNPAGPAEDMYPQDSRLRTKQALHIIENLRAHIPPSQPGTCRQIAINRESEINTAIERVQSASPYTFIEGELGFGKSFFLHWARDEVLPWTAVSLVDLDDRTNFLNLDTLVDAFRANLETPRSLDHTDYANGLDELWDTTLRKTADLCASYYEGQGFEVREDRMKRSLEMAAEYILSEANVPPAVVNEVAETASRYFDSGYQSLSQTLLEDIRSDNPMNVLELMSSLAQINGYRLLLGVDELEKSVRSEKHFESIDNFIEQKPTNTCLFVTGTPELVEGDEEGNTLQKAHHSLYDRTVEQRIRLHRPSRADLIEFSQRIVEIEAEAIKGPADREYRSAIDDLNGFENATDAFLKEQSPAFRSYLNYLEQQ